jgi:hypothetical protein
MEIFGLKRAALASRSTCAIAKAAIVHLNGVSGDIGDRKHFDAAPAIARLILDRNEIVKRAGIGITDAE